MWQGSLKARGVIVVAVAVALGIGACASADPSSSTASSDFAHPVGVATAPPHPLLPSRVPKEWKLTSASLVTGTLQGGVHSLYLGPGATITRGPAIVVGYSGDDQWTPLCSDGSAAPPHDWARFTYVTGPQPDWINDTVTWALGRDVSESTLERVVLAVRWAGEDNDGLHRDQEDPPVSTIAVGALPAGFRLTASSYFGPGEQLQQFERLQYTNTRDSRPLYVDVAAGNRAVLTLARFWRDALEPSCPGGFRKARTWIVHGNVVTALAWSRQPTAEMLVSSLRPVSREEWDSRTGALVTTSSTAATSG